MSRFNIIERLATGEETKIGSAIHIDGEMFVTNTYIKAAVGRTLIFQRQSDEEKFEAVGLEQFIEGLDEAPFMFLLGHKEL